MLFVVVVGVGKDYLLRCMLTGTWESNTRLSSCYKQNLHVRAVEIECALMLSVVGNALGVDLDWVQTRQNSPLEATLVIIAHVDDSVLVGYVRRRGHVTASCKGPILSDDESEIINNVDRKAAATFGKVFDAIQ